MGLSRATAVSYVQQRATLRIVYPPPPSIRRGRLKLFMYSTHLACPTTAWKKKQFSLMGFLKLPVDKPVPITSRVLFQLLAFNGEVKATKPVSWERVSATLENHSTGLVHLHYLGHDLQKQHRPLKRLLCKGMEIKTSQLSSLHLLTGLNMASYDSSSIPSLSG